MGRSDHRVGTHKRTSIGIGAIIRDQLIAVLLVIVITQVLEPIVRFTAIAGLIRLTPSNLTDAVAGGGLLSMVTGVDLLDQGTATLALVGLAAVIVVVGGYRSHRYELR